MHIGRRREDIMRCEGKKKKWRERYYMGEVGNIRTEREVWELLKTIRRRRKGKNRRKRAKRLFHEAVGRDGEKGWNG